MASVHVVEPPQWDFDWWDVTLLALTVLLSLKTLFRLS